MPAVFPDILEAWNNPTTRHAMVIHFPVALSVIGVVFALIAALTGPKSNTMRWTALGVYVALAASALVARETGEDAEEVVRGSLDEQGQQELEDHKSHGLNLWLWPAGISVLIGVSFVPRRVVRLPAAWAAVAVSLLAADQIAHTADHGGRLVYRHGAGTPDDLAALLASPDDAGGPPGDPRVSFFRDQVRPILVQNCLRCHNPKRAKRSGGLDQTRIAGLLEGGWSGPAIVPGRPAESLLLGAVKWEDPDLQMPLDGDKLADEQIAALERWIAEGAVWEPFEIPDQE